MSIYTQHIRPVIGCRIACDVDVRFSITRSGRIARDYTTVQIFIISLFKKRRGHATRCARSIEKRRRQCDGVASSGRWIHFEALFPLLFRILSSCKLIGTRSRAVKCAVNCASRSCRVVPSIKIGTCQPRKRHSRKHVLTLHFSLLDLSPSSSFIPLDLTPPSTGLRHPLHPRAFFYLPFI